MVDNPTRQYDVETGRLEVLPVLSEEAPPVGELETEELEDLESESSPEPELDMEQEVPESAPKRNRGRDELERMDIDDLVTTDTGENEDEMERMDIGDLTGETDDMSDILSVSEADIMGGPRKRKPRRKRTPVTRKPYYPPGTTVGGMR